MKRNYQLKVDIYNKAEELASQKYKLESEIQEIQVWSLVRNLPHILNSIIGRITPQTRDLAISQLLMLFNGLVYQERAFENKSTESLILLEAHNNSAWKIEDKIDVTLYDKLEIFKKNGHIYDTITQIVIHA